ncbi:MAG: hypothetical protein B7Z08_04370 [Sphingomonadales bacterium 32-68-7]|nr:MAG: hypothetical protein B7Z33_04795 [Sphingomonadales bacterium 12-68-11]OYX09653.1 MAG: hypothetical protein B7Z08_04370 [Sphingomonadales bacterium 32-68-7]
MFRIALLSAAAASALAMPAAAADVQIQATGPVVELTVQGSVDAAPDIARVGAGVTTQAPTAVEAMRLNAAAMSAVVARIRQLGIAERDIQTTSVSLGAQYDYDQGTQRQVFRGYQASNRVSVVLRRIDRTGVVLDALVAAGATDISGPDWSLDDDTAARRQARARALESATALVADYARATGHSGSRLLSIEEAVSSPGPVPMYRMALREAADASTPVVPGQVEAGVTLTVRYELTK